MYQKSNLVLTIAVFVPQFCRLQKTVCSFCDNTLSEFFDVFFKIPTLKVLYLLCLRHLYHIHVVFKIFTKEMEIPTLLVLFYCAM